MRNSIKTALLFLLLAFVGTSTFAGNGKLSKDLQKSYKKECKQLKKDGWKVYDKALSLEDAMMVFYQRLDAGGKDIQHIVATGKGKKVNLAYSKAQNSAKVQLASMRESKIEGQTTINMSQSAEGSANEAQTSIRSNVEQTVKAFTPVVSLSRTLPDGTEEIRLYYLINL